MPRSVNFSDNPLTPQGLQPIEDDDDDKGSDAAFSDDTHEQHDRTVVNDIGRIFSFYEGVVISETVIDGAYTGATTLDQVLAVFDRQDHTEHLHHIRKANHRSISFAIICIGGAAFAASIAFLEDATSDCLGKICMLPFLSTSLLTVTTAVFIIASRRGLTTSLDLTGLILFVALLICIVDILLHWRYSLWIAHLGLVQTAIVSGKRPLPDFLVLLCGISLCISCVHRTTGGLVPDSTLPSPLRDGDAPGKEVIELCVFSALLMAMLAPHWKGMVYARLLLKRQELIASTLLLMQEGNYTEARRSIEAVFGIGVSATAGRIAKASMTKSKGDNKRKIEGTDKDADPTNAVRVQQTRFKRNSVTFVRRTSDWMSGSVSIPHPGDSPKDTSSHSSQSSFRNTLNAAPLPPPILATFMRLSMKFPFIRLEKSCEIFADLSEAVLRLQGEISALAGDAMVVCWEGSDDSYGEGPNACAKCIVSASRLLVKQTAWNCTAACGPVHRANALSASTAKYHHVGAPVRMVSRLSELCESIFSPLLVTEGLTEAAAQNGMICRPVDVVPYHSDGSEHDPEAITSLLCITIYSVNLFQLGAFGLQKVYEAAFDDFRVGEWTGCLEKLAACRDKNPNELDFQRLETLAKAQLQATTSDVLPEQYFRGYVGWADYENKANRDLKKRRKTNFAA